MAKVLIVNNDTSLLSVLSAILTSKGYEIVTASDTEVLTKFGPENPDLVVIESDILRTLLVCDASSKSKNILTFADMKLDLDIHEVKRGEDEFNLTPHEFELLTTFMRHPNQALSRNRLCSEVWGYAFMGESNVIEEAIKNLRKKLEASGGKRLIQTIRGYGYILREE